MLTLEQFIKTPKCRPFLLPDEDEIQDREIYRRKEREDQEKQYEGYIAQFESGSDNGVVQPQSKEEARIAQRLESLTKGKVVQPVSKERCTTKKDAKWWKNYRSKAIKCPKCGHEFHKVRRV